MDWQAILAKDYVRSVAVASDGALWFGTWDFGGTSRFDGQTWTSFLAGRDVLSIAAAPDGALWFGTTGEGVARYVPPD
jgi:ligand-binding sensor domain-containing protein